MGKHYSNPPLIEALLEIKWKLNKIDNQSLIDPAYPLLTGILLDKVKDDLPFIEKLPASDIPDAISPYMVKVRFRRAENSWPVIQVGPGVATLNFVTDYVWDSFFEYSKKFYTNIYDSYIKASNQGPPVIESILLRYINRVDIDTSDPVLEFLKENLHIGLELPSSILNCPESTGNANGLVLNVDCFLPNPKAQGSIKIRTLTTNTENALIWEILIHSISSNCDMVQTQEGFESWLSQAHKIAENWFYALIEGELEKKFGVIAQ